MNHHTTSLQIPRIVIAGVHSDCGKTTVTRGLMAALVRRGMIVQPFKVGPDFIDPSHHSGICGRKSRNLDPIMMGEKQVRETFITACAGADIAVIEGVMGMFDGLEGTHKGSSAHVARLLDAPVILVIPVKGMSGSVHAITEGFRKYDPNVHMAGVILNMVGSSRHKEMLQTGKTIEQFGFVPVSESLKISSRHLGLYMAGESAVPHDLAELMEENCDIDSLIAVAHDAPSLIPVQSTTPQQEDGIRIAVAYDEAFCFYYQDNLDRLKNAGAELTFFSPITEALPPVDLLYLGGGYPELHADSLGSSPACRQIRTAVEDGMPVLGECGGLMYLGRGLSGGDENGKEVRWVDILPAEAWMERRFQALGYTQGVAQGGPSLAPAGTPIQGHEFHYSRIEPEPDARYAIRLSRGKGICEGKDGIYVENCMGCYTHAYFSEEMAGRLVDAGHRFQHR